MLFRSVRFSQALLGAGGMERAARARDLLRETLTTASTDERVLYLLSQAERLSGDAAAAETVARRLVEVNRRSVRGWEALVEALETRQRHQAVVDALAPQIDAFRTGANASTALGVLLPHLGFAYQEVGQVDKAVATFEEEIGRAHV